VNKAENNEQFDTDILQCKVDILRARNITPLHDNTLKNPVAQNSAIETIQSSDAAEISACKDANLIPIETMPAKEIPPLPGPKEEAETSEETPDSPRCDSVATGIPSFDLAEEIMAEQRKITAIRRKAPGKKTEVQRLKLETRIADHIIDQSKPLLSEQEKIIAEIVAKDIEKLCRGDYSANNK
jgi:hypothetical protein